MRLKERKKKEKMLIEKMINDALKDFLSGEKVVTVTVYDDGSVVAEKLEDVLQTEDVHYLVDVPAVENPDFSQAVADMIYGSDRETPGEKINTPPQ
mgnify:CR=1 FL=1